MTILALSSSLGTTRAMWDPILPLVGDRYELLAYDHPGHGESPIGPRTLAGLARFALDQLPDRFQFCGISLGGLVGLWIAANAPERVERLVLCCTAPGFPPSEGWIRRAAIVRARGMDALADTVLERWFTSSFPERERYRQMLLSIPAEGYARCCEAIRDTDLRADLARIDAPTLVLAGRDDPAVSTAATNLLGTIGGARVVELPGKHLARVEHPREFVKALTA